MNEQERIESIKWNGGAHLKNFKKENITYGMCLAAVENTGSALQYVPEEFRDKKIYTEACRTYGLALASVPEGMKTKEMYELAVKQNGTALQFVPEVSITADLCRYAALSCPEAFTYIPKAYITAELVLESLKAQSKPKWDYAASKNVMTSGLESFNRLPVSVRDNDMCLALVSLEPALIWELPKKNRTAKVCKAAVKSFGYDTVEEAVLAEPRLISRMHASLCTEPVSLAFVNSDYFTDAVRFNRDPAPGEKRGMKASIIGGGNFFLNGDEFPLKNILRWRSAAGIAVRKCWQMLQYVPKEDRDMNLCMEAVKADAYSIMFVPDKCRTKELCLMAYEKDPHISIEYMPIEYITDEMCYKLIKDIDTSLMAIPDARKTKEICLAAVRKNPSQVNYVPEDILDDEIAITAIEGGAALYYIPESRRSYEVYLAAVKADSDALRNVPDKYKTDELLQIAEALSK